MRAWGDRGPTDQVLTDWLVRLFDRNLWLDIGRKRPIPHEAKFQVAGYFYYFGHYYAALCIDVVPAATHTRCVARAALWAAWVMASRSSQRCCSPRVPARCRQGRCRRR